ncbi:hypothetical protein RHECNPAF_1330078 [Rhizobium etli CNPAF512]|nr:hypothetical protein RHECNPAF_1330078 [Rhizobium etli CNPAF512]
MALDPLSEQFRNGLKMFSKWRRISVRVLQVRALG